MRATDGMAVRRCRHRIRRRLHERHLLSPGRQRTLRPVPPDPGRCTPPDQPQPDRQHVLGDVTAPCAAQTPPPNPAAAGPDDGRVRSSPSWRVHEPCTCTEAVALMGAATDGHDGFREAQILLRRVRERTLTLPRDQAFSGSAGHVLHPATCYRQVITASLLQTPVVASPTSWR